MSIIAGTAIESALGGYEMGYGVRFNSADSAYLSRTPGVVGNRNTWTLSFWLKRSKISDSAIQTIWGTTSNTDLVGFDTDDVLRVWFGTNTYNIETTQVFRDVGAWGHFVVAVNTTLGPASTSVKIYYNGTQITAFSTATYPTLNYNTGTNNTVQHRIGKMPSGDYNYFDGYLADFYLIDGQQLDPTSFGEFNTTTGVWQPIEYTGSYGTNGFHLPFNQEYPSFTAEYATIAGGGGGGGGEATGGGGGAGGAGGAIYNSTSIYVGPTYTVTVGAGGSAGGLGGTGSNSVLGSVTAHGGGGGARRYSGNATSGGSGGGAQYYAGPNSPGTGITGEGNDGGIAASSGGGGGGGGKGSAGGIGGIAGAKVGGTGGTGFDISSYFGTFAPNSGLVAGGGGGGAGNYTTNTTSTGGSASHGGGTGGAYNGGQVVAGAGTTNTGGGGGGGGNNDSSVGYSGGAGGSGVVMIKVPDTHTARFSSGVTYSASTAVSGYRVYAVTATSTTSETVTFVEGVSAEVLIVAGGGGAIGRNVGGGGGAGGLLYYGSETPKTPNGAAITLLFGTPYTVTVGAGGAGSAQSSSVAGSNSVFDTYTALGGGARGTGTTGGSGWGGDQESTAAGSGTSGQGNNGGSGYATYGPSNWAGGGGGGAGAAGGSGSGASSPGVGGVGLQYSISGSATYYAGGGGASGFSGPGAVPSGTFYSSAGGNGGGGAGGGSSGTGVNGTANRGGGGGGGAGISGTATYSGGSGGSGVVVFKVPADITATFSGGVTSSSTTSGGYKIYTVTATSTTSETVTFS